MCSLHKYCLICVCLCTACSRVISAKSERGKHIAQSEVNGTAQLGPADVNINNVNNGTHDSNGSTVYQPSVTKKQGLHYVKLIFEKFGDDAHITKENLIKLFSELEHAENIFNEIHHDHTEHSEKGDSEHGHSENGHSEHGHSENGHSEHGHSENGHSEHEHNENSTRHDNSDHNDHKMDETNSVNSGTKISSTETVNSGINSRQNRRRRTATELGRPVNRTMCLDINQLLQVYQWDNLAYMTPEQFLYFIPGAIYQLDNPNCGGRVRPHSKSPVSSAGVGFSHISAEAWGYSTLAVILISLVGLLGVAVIPIMQRVFYNHLLQFLVALAVGALTGDALLHLLPHALVGGHNHGSSLHDDHGPEEGRDNGHHMAVLKGLCGLLGLFFFFVMERVVTIVTNIKRKRKQSMRKTLSPKETTKCTDERNHVAKKLSAYDETDSQSCEEMVMVVHPNKSLKGFADENHHTVFHTSHEACISKENRHSHGNPHVAAEEEGMLSSQPHAHGGHAHHAHCEMLTSSVASIAWMVILGDGIHNFCDGLAIGAGFADSTTGGFSTSIAVFCHELPHEIGDFAVLLRAGMSIKQAVFYNMLSSVLCFVGMLIGVAIGNIEQASAWIFACVAGMFIYIAMVDMLPEMTSVDTKRGENPFCHLTLQCAGMLLGAGIMLLIAFYEEDLLTALGDY